MIQPQLVTSSGSSQDQSKTLTGYSQEESEIVSKHYHILRAMLNAFNIFTLIWFQRHKIVPELSLPDIFILGRFSFPPLFPKFLASKLHRLLWTFLGLSYPSLISSFVCVDFCFCLYNNCFYLQVFSLKIIQFSFPNVSSSFLLPQKLFLPSFQFRLKSFPPADLSHNHSWGAPSILCQCCCWGWEYPWGALICHAPLK